MEEDLTLEERTQTLGPGSFRKLIPEFDRVHLISDIQSERLTDEELRRHWLYPGDGATFGLSDDKVKLYLTNFSNNPLTKDPKSASKSLVDDENFFVNPDDARSLMAKADSSNGVVTFNLSSPGIKEHLRNHDDEYGHIEVSTAKLAEGTEAFEKEYGRDVTDMFKNVHGQVIYGENGLGAMLSKEKRKKTRIWLVMPGYVQEKLGSKEDGTMIARASYLYHFGSNSYVVLGVRNVNGHRHVRGLVKSASRTKVKKQARTHTQQDVKSAPGQPIPYEDAMKLIVEKYSTPGNTLFPVFNSLINEIYKKNK